MEKWDVRSGRSIEIIYLLSMQKKMFKETVPQLRNALSYSIHSSTEYLNSLEKALTGIDDAMHRLEVTSVSRSIFEDFIAGRDLIKELIYNLKSFIEAGKRYIETLDKILFWADKELYP